MKQKIKDFLIRKRFFKKSIKVLKNKKGFSLLEVLIGVAIIGIISGIAIPRFQDYRETATVTATDTTANNLAKAYNLCLATGTGTCLSLDDLKINCPMCETTSFSQDTTDQSVCMALKKTVGNKNFNGCVEVSSDGVVKKTYGGSFKVCWGKDTSNPAVLKVWSNKVKKCDKNADCPGSEGPTGWTAPECKGGAGTGVCTTGNCS